ncbi:DUF6474 family protein [Actinomycetospora endophytica]|uniref:DUF6474 family protein n=1 Tax=Actinomycetospora endophytica TaxID=2291215 RepID=A0ABS8P870_9PSEU|nr:DUF6474 family protein [Actinomycetospora endophytica]MCD2193239.1 DUF6474 family protein [Actinomycetospora endophytica]
MARRRSTKNSVELGGEHGSGDEGVVVLSRKAAKQAAKAEKETAKAARSDKKATKKAEKAADAELAEKAGKDEPLTSATVKRWIGIAKIVVPVAAPIVYQAVGEARSRVDDYRARRLGVAPDELSTFSGRGTALYARCHNLANSVRELGNRRPDDAEVRTFSTDARTRLSDLEAAVRSAEQMPSARRRRAHLAVASELDRLESRLLGLWGLDAPGGRAPGEAAPGR